jgi:hypothetical protein
LTKSDGQKGTFSTQNPFTTTPTIAYYPYDASASKTLGSDKLMYIPLAGTSDDRVIYNDKAEVKMPMVGTIDGKQIAFKNTTALVKITVVNMPTDYTRAELIANNGSKLSGTGYVDVTDLASNDQPILKLDKDDDGNSNTIIISKDANGSTAFRTTDEKAGGTFDFYFVVPEGNYATGLTFALDKESTDLKKIFTRKGSISANKLYTKTLRFDENGVLLTDDYSTWNEDLAAGNDLDATISSKGTLFIPAAEDPSNPGTITLNLNLAVSGQDNALTIKAAEDNKVTPNVVINLDKESNKDAELVINLPQSSVELSGSIPEETKAVTRGEGSTSVTYDYTLAKLTSSTSDDILRIKAGLQVTLLVVKAGNVFIEEGAAATVTRGTGNNATVYVVKAGSKSDGNLQSNVKEITESTYGLMFPKSGTITLEGTSTTKTLDAAITIGSGKDVTLDLAGNSLSSAATESAIIVKDGGKLKITDSSNGTAGTIQANSTTGIANTPTLSIENGGTVELEKVTLSNALGNAVKVAGANSQFTMTSGTITAAANKDAIAVTTGGEVNINTTTAITGDVNINAGKATIAAASLGKLTVDGASAETDIDLTGAAGSLVLTNGNNDINVVSVTTSASVAAGTATITTSGALAATTVTGGKVTLNPATAGNVSVSAGSVKLNGGAITGTLAVTATGTLELAKGTLTGNVTVEGTSADAVGTFNQTGGEITYATTGAAAVAVSKFGVANISAGTIANTSSTAPTDVALSLTSTDGVAAANISGTAKLTSAHDVIALTGSDTNAINLKIEGTAELAASAAGTYAAIGADATASAKSEITIDGGKFDTNFQDAIKIANGTKVTINGGTFKGSKTAVNIADGTLEVPAASTATFEGANVFVTTASKKAIITLASASASYTASETVDASAYLKGYVLYVPTNGEAALSINGGRYKGDVLITPTTITKFISSGKFSNCDNFYKKQSDYLVEGRILSRVQETEDEYWDVILEKH